MKIRDKYSFKIFNFRRCDIGGGLGKLLGAYKRISRFFLKLRGVSEDDVAYKRIVSGEAWEDFCDTLKSAGASVLGMDSPKDPVTQAEGYRYLSRLIRAGLEGFVEYADPAFPVLRRMVHETVKIGADNPDNVYLNAAVRGEYDYIIEGKRNSINFLGFSTQQGNYGDKEGLPATGFLDGADLALEEDGSFSVRVSTKKQTGNWLPMEPETNLLIVRQTYLDREHEIPAELSIRRVTAGGEPRDDGGPQGAAPGSAEAPTSASPAAEAPAPLTPAKLVEGLDTASKLVAGASFLFARWAKQFKVHTNELPQMPPEVSNAAGGDPKIAYYHSYWRLAPDEALIIEVTPPSCEFWNFQVNNHWMESLDYRYFPIHVNAHSAVYEKDGSVKIVVAHKNPGCPNWLTTAGHPCGTMLFRWVKADSHPQPKTRVVKTEALSKELGK